MAPVIRGTTPGASRSAPRTPACRLAGRVRSLEGPTSSSTSFQAPWVSTSGSAVQGSPYPVSGWLHKPGSPPPPPPSVTLTGPVNGQAVDGIVGMSASATNATSVHFYVDGGDVGGAGSSSGSFILAWDSTT